MSAFKAATMKIPKTFHGCKCGATKSYAVFGFHTRGLLFCKLSSPGIVKFMNAIKKLKKVFFRLASSAQFSFQNEIKAWLRCKNYRKGSFVFVPADVINYCIKKWCFWINEFKIRRLKHFDNAFVTMKLGKITCFLCF